MYLGTRDSDAKSQGKEEKKIAADVIYDQLQERTKGNQQLDKTQRIKTRSGKLSSDAKFK